MKDCEIAFESDRGDETFAVVLSTPSTGVVITNDTAVATIVDHESLPIVVAEGAGTAPISASDPVIAEALEAAIARWVTAGINVRGLSPAVADLPGALLASADGVLIKIETDAAGWGWTVNGGSIDLIAVLQHELGHVLGLTHDDAARFPIMAPEIGPLCVFSSASSASVTLAEPGGF